MSAVAQGTRVYLVFKEGIYRHECAGVFTSLPVAEGVAARRIAGERDDYHVYTLVAMDLDSETPQTPATPYTYPSGRTVLEGGELVEPTTLCAWSRKGTEVTCDRDDEAYAAELALIAARSLASKEPR